jgi:hypothetical protein
MDAGEMCDLPPAREARGYHGLAAGLAQLREQLILSHQAGHLVVSLLTVAPDHRLEP